MAPKLGMKLTYGQLGLLREHLLKEGDVVMATIMGVRGKSRGPTLTDEMRKGQWVKLIRPHNPEDERLVVERALPEEIHQHNLNLDEPRLVIGRMITDAKWGGREPNTDLNYGEYENRHASIDLIGRFMQDVFLEEGNDTILPGDSIQPTSYKYSEAKEYDDIYVDKTDTYNGSIVIYGAPANAPATQTIRVLYPTHKIGGA